METKANVTINMGNPMPGSIQGSLMLTGSVTDEKGSTPFVAEFLEEKGEIVITALTNDQEHMKALDRHHDEVGSMIKNKLDSYFTAKQQEKTA